MTPRPIASKIGGIRLQCIWAVGWGVYPRVPLVRNRAVTTVDFGRFSIASPWLPRGLPCFHGHSRPLSLARVTACRFPR